MAQEEISVAETSLDPTTISMLAVPEDRITKPSSELKLLNNDIVDIRIEEETSTEDGVDEVDEVDHHEKEKPGMLSALFRRLYKRSNRK